MNTLSARDGIEMSTTVNRCSHLDGDVVYGDVVAYAVRETLAAVLASGVTGTYASTIQQAGYRRLPIPISHVAAQQDTETWCSEGASFQSVATCFGGAGACKWKMLNWHDTCPY
jgi:hypothetical protein